MSTSSTPTVPPETDGQTDLEAAKVPTSTLDKVPKKRTPLQRLKPGFDNPPPFKEVARRSWSNILTQLLCVLAAYLIYLFALPLMPRYFPVYPGMYTSAFGLKYGKPFLDEYITTFVSATISFLGPFLIIGAIGLWKTRDFWDTHKALLTLGAALATATLFQAFIKWTIGGLRPHFLAVCNPPIPPPFPGLGPTSIWYTSADVCRGDPKLVREAQMSFPSGHACAAVAGFGFLALYLNKTFHILARGGRENGEGAAPWTSHWKLVLFVAPLLLAIIIAASKVRDAWHHAFDVVAGCWIGWLFALGAYKTMFKKKSGVEGRPLGEKDGVGKELEPEEKERLNKQKAV